MAYDFKEAFFCIYDEPDKQSAQNAFEAWENSLPPYGMEPFKKLVKRYTTITTTSLPTGMRRSQSPMAIPKGSTA
uniref:Uncharacterized protein n=1 Tax=Klebsiella pneumoniae TaxID=573 RepID=A0A2P1BP84_KLEPN|nr:hypothetical protein [Klebsiella pneumoniae]